MTREINCKKKKCYDVENKEGWVWVQRMTKNQVERFNKAKDKENETLDEGSEK